MTTDADLLRQYAGNGSQEAFAALVQRYLNLVYSAALRQVAGDSHMAKDVSQYVFTALARQAAGLQSRPALGGWLYTTTHFAAAKVVRTERRRRARELEAHNMNQATSTDCRDEDWSRLRPVLDNAMLQLNTRERNAVLLRFFERRPLADVGRELGMTENTAAKNVERALEKLRGLLARSGFTSTSAALAAVLAEQATAAAPAGLAQGIASFAAANGAAATGAIAFMGLGKAWMAIATSAAVIAVVAALHENRRADARTTAVESLALDRAALGRRVSELEAILATQATRATASVQAAPAAGDGAGIAVDGAAAPADAPNDAPMIAMMRSFFTDLEEFHAWVQEHPEQQVPELKYLTERDWMNVVLRHFGGTGNDELARKLSDLRNTGRDNFSILLRYALNAYSVASPGRPLTDIEQLKPYFDPPVADAVLADWAVLTDDERKTLKLGSELVVAQKAGTRINNYDAILRLGPTARTSATGGGSQTMSLQGAQDEALDLFRSANHGQSPERPEQLAPYFKDPNLGKRYLTSQKQDSNP